MVLLMLAVQVFISTGPEEGAVGVVIRLSELPRGQQRRPCDRGAVAADLLSAEKVVVGGGIVERVEGERSFAGAIGPGHRDPVGGPGHRLEAQLASGVVECGAGIVVA